MAGKTVSFEHRAFGKTDIGLVRTGNEDSFFSSEKISLHVVCDGMGGHKAGEVASQFGAWIVHVCFESLSKGILGDQRLFTGQDLAPQAELLARSIRLANRYVFNKAAENQDMSGMGSTIVALTFDDSMVHIAHVGDSRLYRIRDKQLEPLTEDHSWISEIQKTSNISQEQANSFVGKNVITRALGVRDNVEVDVRTDSCRKDDIYLLCSDGLCGFATDEEILATCLPSGNKLEEIADNLIALANSKGGSDNVTVVLIEITDADQPTQESMPAVTCIVESTEALEGADEWLKKIDKLADSSDDDPEATLDSKPTSKSKLPIIMIFSAFLIIAVLTVIFSSGK